MKVAGGNPNWSKNVCAKKIVVCDKVGRRVIFTNRQKGVNNWKKAVDNRKREG